MATTWINKIIVFNEAAGTHTVAHADDTQQIGQNLYLTGTSTTATLDGYFIINGITVPALAPASSGRIYFDSTGNVFKASENGGVYFNLIGASGPAGGDLSGTYPNPTVAKINGVSVPATPSANQILFATSGTVATWGQITDGNVSVTAAISGSKISPNFGTQTLTAGGSAFGTTTTVSSIVGSLKFTTKTFSGPSDGYIDTGTKDLIIYADTSGSAFRLILPIPTNGRTIIVKDKKQSFAANNLTLTRNSAEKIDGYAGNLVLSINNKNLVITSDGTDWYTNNSGYKFTDVMGGTDLTGSFATPTIINLSGNASGIVTHRTNNLQFNIGVVAPTITQGDNTAASATAQNLIIKSQRTVNVGTTGGNFSLKSGTGTSGAGSVLFQINGITKFQNSTAFCSSSSAHTGGFNIYSFLQSDANGLWGMQNDDDGGGSNYFSHRYSPSPATSTDRFGYYGYFTFQYTPNTTDKIAYAVAAGRAFEGSCAFWLPRGYLFGVGTGKHYVFPGRNVAQYSKIKKGYRTIGDRVTISDLATANGYYEKIVTADGYDGSEWQASASEYLEASTGNFAFVILPIINNSSNHAFQVLSNPTSGLSGAVRPNWDGYQTLGNTLVDGYVTWQNVGTACTYTKANKIQGNITSVTTTYTVLSSDEIVNITNITAPFTISLPSSPILGQTHTIKDGYGGCFTNNITIDGYLSGAGKTIDGVNTILMNQDWSSITVYYNGTQWNVIKDAKTHGITASTNDFSATGTRLDIVPKELVLGANTLVPLRNFVSSAQTTSASFVTIASYTIPTNSLADWSFTVLGWNVTGGTPDGYYYRADFVFKSSRLTGAPTLTPSSPTATNVVSNGGGSAYSAQVILSTNLMSVQVSGAAAKTINWSCIGKYQKVS